MVKKHQGIKIKKLKDCEPGRIMRVAYSYTNRYGKRVHVKATCIEDRGKKGKGPTIIPKLHKGLLTKYGYKLDKPVAKRREALEKAYKAYGGRNLIDKLVAILVLNKSRKVLHAKIANDLKFVREMYKEQKKKMKMKGGMSCPPGKIARESYRRKGYTKANGTRIKATVVKAGCVKDQGAVGKGPKLLPKPKSGALKKYGYSLHLTEKERQAALRRAMRKEGGLAVLRRIILIRNLNKGRHRAHVKLTKDQHYIQKLYDKKKKTLASAKKK